MVMVFLLDAFVRHKTVHVRQISAIHIQIIPFHQSFIGRAHLMYLTLAEVKNEKAFADQILLRGSSCESGAAEISITFEHWFLLHILRNTF